MCSGLLMVLSRGWKVIVCAQYLCVWVFTIYNACFLGEILRVMLNAAAAVVVVVVVVAVVVVVVVVVVVAVVVVVVVVVAAVVVVSDGVNMLDGVKGCC